MKKMYDKIIDVLIELNAVTGFDFEVELYDKDTKSWGVDIFKEGVDFSLYIEVYCEENCEENCKALVFEKDYEKEGNFDVKSIAPHIISGLCLELEGAKDDLRRKERGEINEVPEKKMAALNAYSDAKDTLWTVCQNSGIMCELSRDLQKPNGPFFAELWVDSNERRFVLDLEIYFCPREKKLFFQDGQANEEPLEVGEVVKYFVSELYMELEKNHNREKMENKKGFEKAKSPKGISGEPLQIYINEDSGKLCFRLNAGLKNEYTMEGDALMPPRKFSKNKRE